MRLSTPRSRRKTMLEASAVKVVDITLIAAIAGTRRLSSCWLSLRMIPPPARNSSGSRKLKNAALGLRQNMRRSRRYWRQARISAPGAPVASRAAPRSRAVPCCSAPGSAIRRQLQVHVLERGTRDAQLRQGLATRQGLAGELVEQARRVLGLALDQLAVAIAVGDAVVRAADA